MALTDRDAVRLRIGDTDTDDLLLTDEEVDFYIDAVGSDLSAGDLDLAAAGAAEAISAKFARDFSFTADGEGFERQQRVLHYRQLAADLRRRGGPFGLRSVGGTA